MNLPRTGAVEENHRCHQAGYWHPGCRAPVAGPPAQDTLCHCALHRLPLPLRMPGVPSWALSLDAGLVTPPSLFSYSFSPSFSLAFCFPAPSLLSPLPVPFTLFSFSLSIALNFCLSLPCWSLSPFLSFSVFLFLSSPPPALSPLALASVRTLACRDISGPLP